MRSVNKVVIIGNVTRDADTRTSNNGQAITTFGVATNRYWMTTDGQKRNSTEFHEVVAWSRLAEICQKMVKKGVPVYIEGYLKTRTWETEAGIRMRKTEIIVQDLIMLERDSKGEYNVPQSELINADFEDTNESPSIIASEEIIDPMSPEPDSQSEPASGNSNSKTSNNVNIDEDLGL